MNWVIIENDEEIKVSSVCGVGKIKAVKVSSGKGEALVERTVYNFAIRIGTGATILKSKDYEDEESATIVRLQLIK